MQHTISDMARYIKNLIPPTIPEAYSVKAMFKSISEEENIRNGVLAYRDLLYSVCDLLIENGSLYDKPSKKAKDSHASLAVSYPFINNVKSILFNIGYHGELIENNESILINDLKILTSIISAEGWQMKAKISGPKLVKALKFLNSCGVDFNGVDLDARTSEILKTKTVKISYLDSPVMFIGLKVMAIAQKDLYSKGNHDLFLRCDYRFIKEEETEIISYLKDFVSPLPIAVQDYVLKLHQRYIDAGLTCKLDVFYLGVRFIYSRKSKEVFTFSAAHDSGYRMLIKAQKTDLYADVIDTFPLVLQKKISRGYGCNKKLFGEPCEKGCHGFSFSLDESIIEISQDIEVWLDEEVSFGQRGIK